MQSRVSSVCSTYFAYYNPKTMVCGTKVNANICFGDSGTTMGTYANQKFQVDGVNSFVSGNGCDHGPNGFARVWTFMKWIQKYVK